ncbi:thermonuclease family protein [Jeotgalibacillus haloalkalitolerans]|uniref:thermonuclease family protein n=1 Tax=Jeotgalibacillus haloalkalitolerans TaxID=3104292 RepID=UPI002ACC383D|nr:thermonuclease family protein [Jeotgalibacillus sp. HH7-29]
MKKILLTAIITSAFSLTAACDYDRELILLLNEINQIIDTVPEAELSGREVQIIRVVDGDTVIVNDQDKEEMIRLLLIDTPESIPPSKEKEYLGESSSDFAKVALNKGDTVTLEIGNPDRDAYGRLLGYIWVDDTNFNQLMIEEGFARVVNISEPNTKYLDEFIRAEEQAKEQKIGIWSVPGYVTENGFDMSAIE